MVRRFMAFFRYKIGKEINGISDEALQALCEYEWPGNVRELMNVIERAILLCKTDEITMVELPHVFRNADTGDETAFAGGGFNMAEWMNKTLPEIQQAVMARVEHQYLSLLLKKNKGRVDLTARMAGIHPRGLYNKMKQLGLRKEDFKQR